MSVTQTIDDLLSGSLINFSRSVYKSNNRAVDLNKDIIDGDETFFEIVVRHADYDHFFDLFALAVKSGSFDLDKVPRRRLKRLYRKFRALSIVWTAFYARHAPLTPRTLATLLFHTKLYTLARVPQYILEKVDYYGYSNNKHFYRVMWCVVSMARAYGAATVPWNVWCLVDDPTFMSVKEMKENFARGQSLFCVDKYGVRNWQRIRMMSQSDCSVHVASLVLAVAALRERGVPDNAISKVARSFS